MHLSQQIITISHLAIVYDDRSKLLSGFCIVKCSSSLSYLNQKGLPLIQVFSKTVVYIFSLHIPQTLVLQPNLMEVFHSVQNFSSIFPKMCFPPAPGKLNVHVHFSCSIISCQSPTLTYCSTSVTIPMTAEYDSSRAAGPSGILVNALR